MLLGQVTKDCSQITRRYTTPCKYELGNDGVYDTLLWWKRSHQGNH